jgi:hypothetical protein
MLFLSTWRFLYYLLAIFGILRAVIIYLKMKLSLLILWFMAGVGLGTQKESLNQSKWRSGDKVNISDFTPLKKTGLYYYLSNDNENIYIDLRIEDAEAQNMILKHGLIIWIDMEGKSKKNLGVRFPMGSQNQGTPNPAKQSANPVTPEGQPVSGVSLANRIELIGFTNEVERHFPSENADNFSGYVKFDMNRILYYYMKMPIAKLPVRNSKDGKGAVPFMLGIEYGFSQETNNQVEKYGVGRNPKTPRIAEGSEIHWIKEVELATSK